VTIWAGNPLQYTILYWAGNPLQYPIKKNSKKQKKWVVFQMTCFLISTSLCKGCMSIYCFQGFQEKKNKKEKKEANVLSVSTFLYKFTTQS
jgi:hypothetical protein